MKNLLFITATLLSLFSANAQTNFTDFFCNTNASNLNAGSSTNTSASFTYASGSWVQSSGVFTVASGNPSSDGVTVGDWASVYPDGSTTTPFVGRVTARDATTITVSLNAKSGSAPTDGSNNRTLKVGGAWKGPNGSEAFPFAFVTGSLTNSSGHKTRVNFKAQTYNITATMSNNTSGIIVFSGYSSTPGDGGRAIFDGGLSGASYALFQSSLGQNEFSDLTFTNNGTTGSADLVGITGINSRLNRCLFINGVRCGASVTTQAILYECGAYNNNRLTNNSTLGCGFFLQGAGATAIRCVSSNPNQKGTGFTIDTPTMLYQCIAYNNGSNGVISLSTTCNGIYQCDFYNNGGSHIDLQSGSATANGLNLTVENCNFFKSGGWAILSSGSTQRGGQIVNCVFGSGTQSNTSGNLSGDISEIGHVNYTSNLTPWVDPANGNFTTTNNAATRFLGRSQFGLTVTGLGSSTTGFPDVGAAQATNSPSTGGSFTFVQ